MATDAFLLDAVDLDELIVGPTPRRTADVRVGRPTGRVEASTLRRVRRVRPPQITENGLWAGGEQ